MKNDAETEDFRRFLQDELMRRCRANPAYSLRAFARSLQMDDSTLAKILNGKRKAGKRAISRMGNRLNLAPDVLASFVHQKSSSAANPDDSFQRIALDSFQVIADWYHFAILELIRVEHFKPDPRWIAKSLGITVSEVHAARERLVRLKLLGIDRSGKWTDLSGVKATVAGPNNRAAAFRTLQKQILEKAIRAVDEVPLEMRDQSAMTMAIDSTLLPEARQKITRFRRSLSKFLSRGKRRDEVYNMSISLYPVSHINER